MTEIDSLREELTDALKKAEDWIFALDDLPARFGGDAKARQEDINEIAGLRRRAASSLINIAFLGAFSSGKSFLLSGLQRHLQYTEAPRPMGLPRPRYDGLIPSRTGTVNAVPVTVVPAYMPTDFGARRFFLRVKFTDSGEWENVGPSVAAATVYAYISDNADSEDRSPEHVGRRVAEVEILLAGAELPAKLYDLPGFDSPNAEHGRVIAESLGSADCLIYVTSASRTLSESELRPLYALHEQFSRIGRRKPIIWVVTAIDQAPQEEEGTQQAFDATVAQNNALLRRCFRLSPDGPYDAEFFGTGFTPVSPAWEAIADSPYASSQAEIYRRESRMSSLRTQIHELIAREAGPRHVASIAMEARLILGARHRRLSGLLDEVRIPLDKLDARATELESRIANITRVTSQITDQLHDDLDRRIKTVERIFKKLGDHLHGTLDAEAKKLNLTKGKDLSQIEFLKTGVLSEWMLGPDGPSIEWDKQLTSMQRDIFRQLRSAAGENLNADTATSSSGLTLDDLELSITRRRRRSAPRDIVQATTAFVGGLSPIAGGVAAALGILTGAALLIPAGVTVGAAAVYAGSRILANRKSSQEMAAEAWMVGLNELTISATHAFIAAARSQGEALIEAAVDVLADRREALIEKAYENELSRSAGETLEAERIVSQLTDTVAASDAIIARLTQLESAAPNRVALSESLR